MHEVNYGISSGSENDGFNLKGEWRGGMKKLALEEETTVVFQSRIKLTRNVFQCKPQENKT